MSYVLCLHRWVGRQALYDEYELPDNMCFRVICTYESLVSLPKRCASKEELPSLDDTEAVMKKAGLIIEAHGVPSIVVALNEGDLLNAALIRENWNIPGDDFIWTERFRDKLKMLEVASQQTAISVLPAVKPESIETMVQEYGFPLVLKPRLGTASKGVVILYSGDQLERIQTANDEPMMVQLYCSAPILHVDGWWDGEKIVVATASKYSSTCAEFGSDTPLGSIELGEEKEEKRIFDSIKYLLEVFAPKKEMVFHLELFDKGDELVFLEIAARVGGAEIPFIWREIRNIDLLGIAWEIQTGLSTRYRDMARELSSNGCPLLNTRGAWVISPLSRNLEVNLETLYWSQDQNLEDYASGVYEGARTRLRFRSSEEKMLECDVSNIVKQLSES